MEQTPETNHTPSDIVWQDPPARRNGHSRYEAYEAALKANPGRWALAPLTHKGEKPHSSATAMWSKKGYESVSRRDESGGRPNVYVRWPAETA